MTRKQSSHSRTLDVADRNSLAVVGEQAEVLGALVDDQPLERVGWAELDGGVAREEIRRLVNSVFMINRACVQ